MESKAKILKNERQFYLQKIIYVEYQYKISYDGFDNIYRPFFYKYATYSIFTANKCEKV